MDKRVEGSNQPTPIWKWVWAKGRGLSDLVLFPFTVLSSLYDASCRLRVLLYEKKILSRKRVDCYVVSVGNLTVGGTGKTPFTIFLARKWKDKGYSVGIISRGYGGRYTEQVLLVSDGEKILHDASKVGDEPYLMAERLKGVPIVVSADRFEGCRWLLERFKIDVILLDDGFQHLRLHRDLNLLLVDAMNPFGNGYLLPRGSLRESVSEVRRADLVIFTRSESQVDATEWIHEIERFGRPCLRSTFQPKELIHLNTGTIHPLSVLKSRPLLCFCGIGNPDSFVNLVSSLGADVREQIVFDDHFPYQSSDFEKIKNRAISLGMNGLVTTEKDAVKIRAFLSPEVDVWALRVDVVFWENPEKWEPLLFKKEKRSLLRSMGRTE